MYSDKSYKLTKEEFYYLAPAISRNKLLHKGEDDTYYLIVNTDDLSDVLNRLKGLYNYFNELPKMISYYCFKEGSIKRFRELFN